MRYSLTPWARASWRALTRRLTRISKPRAVGRRRSRVSRGQAFIEFALLWPVLFLMLAGSTSISILLEDHLNIVYALRSAARVGSTLGQSTNADCAIIGALDAALANDHNINVQQITIYKAQSDGLPDPTDKDVYLGNTICDSSGNITPGATSAGWEPGDRNNQPFVEDSIGVQIQYTYNINYNYLGISFPAITDQAVMPIEVVVSPET